MVSNQAYLFIVFSFIGGIIGIIFDLFRILRKSFKTPNIIIYIEDIIFWIITGLLLLYSIWYFNNGEIRFYIILGIIFGVIIYILTISTFVVNIASRIIIFFKQALYKPFQIIIKTFFKIFRKIKKIIKIKGKKEKNVE